MNLTGSPVAVGDILAGKFRVEKVLGVGGMGVVVAAMHLELEQRVALKFMLSQLVSTPQATERFLREARAAGRLRSEHICRVHDVGKLDDGAPYIMMELLDGEDLSQVLDRREKLPVQEAVDLLLQAIEGIAEAHAHGIVHRDLKPGNLFLTTRNDGSPLVKVLDFGISKLGANSGATATGQIMGSPAYMAPEQMLSSRDVDGRADLWALGVILYQVLSGRLPFDHETLPGLCLAVVNDEPPPLRCGSIDAVVARCLAKQRQSRYADVGALALALAELGSPFASSSATRIVKILRRVSGAQPTVVSDAPARNEVATKQLGTPAPPSIEQRVKLSTLGASTGQSVDHVPEARSPARRQVVAASLAAVVLAGLGLGIGLIGGRRSDASRREPAAVPASSVEESAVPAPPPAPAPDAAVTEQAMGAPLPDAAQAPDAATAAVDRPPPPTGKRRPAPPTPPASTSKTAPQTPSPSGSAPETPAAKEPQEQASQTDADPSRKIYRGTKATISTEYPTN